MKTINALICLAFLIVACQPPVDNSAYELFEKNSKTVSAYLEAYQTESLDHDSFYSADIIFRSTAVGGQDSTTLEQMKEMDAQNFEMFDFELLDSPVVFLPGVNQETKKIDGSVRYYAAWKLSTPATDSTESKSVIVPIYESFDFDENGKIINHVTFGDFGGMMNAISE